MEARGFGSVRIATCGAYAAEVLVPIGDQLSKIRVVRSGASGIQQFGAVSQFSTMLHASVEESGRENTRG
jgi:hypothetical protein